MRAILLTILAIVLLAPVAQAQNLADYASSQREEANEMRRVEKKQFDNACMDPSRQSFQQYLRDYPDGKYVDEAKSRLADFDLWDQTQADGSLQAYKNYKAKSVYKFFLAEANAAIDSRSKLSPPAAEPTAREKELEAQLAAAQRRIADLENLLKSSRSNASGDSPTGKYTDAEGDALVARLARADRQIANLEEQLRNCRKPAR